MIIATKACTQRKNLETELESLRIPYYAELVEKFSIRHSPNLIVDDAVVFLEQPTEAELHAILETETLTWT